MPIRIEQWVIDTSLRLYAFAQTTSVNASVRLSQFTVQKLLHSVLAVDVIGRMVQRGSRSIFLKFSMGGFNEFRLIGFALVGGINY